MGKQLLYSSPWTILIRFSEFLMIFLGWLNFYLFFFRDEVSNLNFWTVDDENLPKTQIGQKQQIRWWC